MPMSHYHFNWNATNNCRNKSSFGLPGCSSRQSKKQWWDRCSCPLTLSRWKLSSRRWYLPQIFHDFCELFPDNFPRFYCCYCFQSPSIEIESTVSKLNYCRCPDKERSNSRLKDMVYKSKSLDPFDAQAAGTFNAPYLDWKPEKDV